MKKQRILGCLMAMVLICTMLPFGSERVYAAGGGKSHKEAAETARPVEADKSKQAEEEQPAKETEAVSNEPVFSVQPEAVRFVTEGSEYKVPSYSVTVELPEGVKADDLTLQWFVNGLPSGKAKTAKEGKLSDTLSAKELAGQKAGVYPVYCHAEYTADGIPYAADSYVANFVVSTGVMKGSVLTIPAVGEDWEKVGKALEMTMLMNDGKIPALVLAANDYKETAKDQESADDAKAKTAKVSKVSKETMRRAELMLGGIGTVWVSAAQGSADDPGLILASEDGEPSLDEVTVEEYDASCTLRELFSEAAAKRGYGPVAYYKLSGVKGKEEEGLAATIPLPSGVTEKDELLILHENDGMVEIIEADEIVVSELDVIFRAYADGVYAIAKKGAEADHSGHAWKFSEFTYEDDGKGTITKAQAVYVCKNDPEHIEFVDAVAKKKETKPTCTEAGSVEWILSISAKKSLDDKEYKNGGYLVTTLEATGHDWGEWTVTKEATATEPGQKTRTCKNDPSHVQTEEIPATPDTTVSYAFTSSGYTWTKNSGQSLEFVVKRSVDDDKTYELFSGLSIDGKYVSKGYYSIEKGSLKITFRSSYLQALSAGTHSLVVGFQDGNATTNFTIKSASGSGGSGGGSNGSNSNNNSSRGRTVKTGDDSQLPLWGTLCAAAGLGIVVLLALRRKGYLR